MSQMDRIVASTIAGLSFAVAGCGSGRIVVDAGAEPVVQTASAVESPGDGAGDTKVVASADRGSALITDLLAPGASGRAGLDVTTSPQRPRAADWPGPTAVPVPSVAPPPRVALEKPLPPQRPGDLLDAPPLNDQLAAPRLPEVPHLPTNPRVREASPDVNQPIPLPFLGHQASDRAPLEDPTVEASLALALALSPPLRTLPAPFVPLFVPNPFPHREAGRLRQPPPEDTTPVTASPRLPKRP